MAEIKRAIYTKLDKLLSIFPCLVILGPRQCGKTFLSRQLRTDWHYFDLENPQTFDRLHDDLNFFFRQNPHQIIFDEAQLSPALFQTLRGVIDNKRSQNNRFILTGSSSPELPGQVSETLAGRAAIVELSPFKVTELHQKPTSAFYQLFEKELSQNDLELVLDFKPTITLDDLLQSFLIGGYPTPVLANDTFLRKNWMEQYFQTYIYRDIKNLFPRLDNTSYRRFIQMLSALSGTIINRSQLGRSLDINEKSIRNYLDIAHGTMVWRNIPAFHHSKVKSIQKMPKGIMRDSGLTHYLQGIDTPEKLDSSPLVGHSFESFIIEEILRGIQTTTVTRWEYSYYRTKSGVEIDLILSGEFGLLPIEIKYGTNTRLKQLSSLQRFIKDHNLPYGAVINNSDKVEMLSEKIIQIPSILI